MKIYVSTTFLPSNTFFKRAVLDDCQAAKIFIAGLIDESNEVGSRLSIKIDCEWKDEDEEE